jgi:hypothetical protein
VSRVAVDSRCNPLTTPFGMFPNVSPLPRCTRAAESPAARAAGTEKAELQVPHHLTRFASPPGVYIPIAWRKNASLFRSICARASESSSW